MIRYDDRGLAALVAQVCICVVVAISVAGIFVAAPALSLVAGAALAVYFMLSWRRFSIATWVPVSLSVLLLAISLWQGLGPDTLIRAIERMTFLAALLAFLGVLRLVASEAPEISRAGRYLTSQPPGRRYLALNFGGHVLGVLVNMGSIAILLDMARRSVLHDSQHLPEHLRELKLRRMTVAVLRGFSLVPLWAPFGFGMNILLMSLPGLHYAQIGPVGFALSFVFVLWGWLMDRLTAPAVLPGAPAPPDPADRGAVPLLLGHVAALGLSTFGLHFGTGLGFQQSLLVAVPVYSLAWAARLGMLRPEGAAGAVLRVVGASIRQFPLAAGEIGVFASAGLLSVLALELIPVERVQAAFTTVSVDSWQMIIAINLTLFCLGTIGINPIITVSILGSLMSQLAVPGLSDLAIALSLAGSWSCVMVFTPFITTVAYASALTGRPAATVGFRWNGLYSLSALALWTAGMAAAVAVGLF
ncbi:MAG: hypothetical protein ACOYJQ_16715 [Pseudochelatococcus sp.]|jgi:hypothetical protein|uniref:hypothetical protein n=1 Tax=Pseudochelatococcus sp. TaxID=2020869 RepID=UPI003D8DD720